MNAAMTTVPQPKGFLVRHFRVKAGLTRQGLAKEANLSLKMIQRAEYGQLTEYTLRCLARALTIAPVNFYDDEELQVFLSGRIATSDRPLADTDQQIEASFQELLDRLEILPIRKQGR